MQAKGLEVKLNRRKMLFKIMRIVTSKLITGNYKYRAVAEISAEQLNDQLSTNDAPLIIDVRPADEFKASFGHIPDSKSIPMMDMVTNFGNAEKFKQNVNELELQIEEVLPFRNKEIVTVCPGGGFSLVAAEIMSEVGFLDTKSLSGGIDGWFKQDFPTTLN